MAFWDYVDALSAVRRGRKAKEPGRDTLVYPTLQQQGTLAGDKKRVAYKPTPRNLRKFSLNPYARRAINAIKNPISMLAWEVAVKPGVELNSELERQIEVATFCLEHPNHDDSMRTLLEQVVEDIMLGAGAIEMQEGSDPERPLWLYPTDGLTIQIYPGWSPDNPDTPRYQQVLGYGNYTGSTGAINLRNDELIYVRPNPTTATPFGHGPLEIAFTTISRILGVADFSGNVASNSRPSIGLDLGDGASDGAVAGFRAYWRNDVEGQGNMPVFAMTSTGNDGKTRGPSVLRFYPEGDDGLYLQYQEFLQRELAAAFDLSPQNLGIEKDVNRSTSEVAEDRDRKQAIAPHAHAISSQITREAIRGKLGFSQLAFRFKGVEAEDENNTAKVYEVEYRNNACTPNEYRTRRGWKPLDHQFANLLKGDLDIAVSAARGTQIVDDEDLNIHLERPPEKPVKPTPPKPKGK